MELFEVTAQRNRCKELLYGAAPGICFRELTQIAALVTCSRELL